MRLDREGIERLEGLLKKRTELSQIGAAVVLSLLDEFKAGKDIDSIELKLKAPAALIEAGPGTVADSISVDSVVSWSKDYREFGRLPPVLAAARRTRLTRGP